MAIQEVHEVDTAGCYKPELPIQFVPLFTWPPKPAALVRFFFGFPGFLLPWFAIFLGVSIVFWTWLTPDMEQARLLSAGWIAPILGRNLLIFVAFVGAQHVLMYRLQHQGKSYKYNPNWLAKDDPNFLFRDQLWDNVFWNIAGAVPVWTFFEVMTLWLSANHYIPTVSIAEHPFYVAALLLTSPIWTIAHFYAIHRFLHWRPLFRHAHHIHHRNINIGPWSGLSMHPFEHLLYFSAVCLYWILPAHPLVAEFTLINLALGASVGHLGFGQVSLGGGKYFNNEHYMHYLHHRYFRVNYTVEMVPLDKWLGTFYDGTDVGRAALKRRSR
jgi:sterol desaturase/sphingolipid hydroxylase (fatty acid hydroxylase superfamily)